MEQSSRKRKIENKHLIGIFVLLILVIIGFLVGIIVGFNNVNTSHDVSEYDCLNNDDEFTVRTCLAQMYEDDKEETSDAYLEAINKALEHGDYDLFENLVFEMGSNLAFDGKCKKAFEFVENEAWIGQLPAVEKAVYYENIQDLANECENDEKYDYYVQKWDELYQNELQYSEEYLVAPEDYINEEEYEE